MVLSDFPGVLAIPYRGYGASGVANVEIRSTGEGRLIGNKGFKWKPLACVDGSIRLQPVCKKGCRTHGFSCINHSCRITAGSAEPSPGRLTQKERAGALEHPPSWSCSGLSSGVQDRHDLIGVRIDDDDLIVNHD